MTRARAPLADLAWMAGEVPRSRLYDDVYFSASGGLEESRAVFLAGCGLPERWATGGGFTVGEVGFGTGRNIAALLELWARTRPPGGHLSIFSVEAHPMAASQAARALANWPEVARAAELLIARWPGVARGFHRVDLPEFGATLDVAIGEAAEALAAWSGLADAWFLDGFSPARNPEIWRAEVMALVRAHSAVGARIASYTVARPVRDALAAAGFVVERLTGFGRKRHRLAASLPGSSAERAFPSRVAIIGAGIAGASLRHGFLAHGIEATVFERSGARAGASGCAAALMAPRLDAGLGSTAELFAQGARRAGALYRTIPGAVTSAGAIQLATGEKDRERFDTISRSDLFAPGTMTPLESGDVAERLSEPSPPGLMMDDALVVSPKVILHAWLGPSRRVEITRIEPADVGWRLTDVEGATVFEAHVVCVATGADAGALAGDLALVPVRGQATRVQGGSWPIATLFGAYVLPTPDGVLVGATHVRGVDHADVLDIDDQQNLDAVSRTFPDLAQRLAAAPRAGWAGVRATTADFLPLAGPISSERPGLMVLAGLGSRGFCLAPLLAEHVAALALGVPSPLPRAVAARVSPGRFAERARRKGRLASAREDAS